MRKMMLAIAAACSLAGSAQAVSFFSIGATPDASGALQDPGVPNYQQTIDTFDQGSSSALVAAQSWGYATHQGSESGVAAAPAGDSSIYAAIQTGGSMTFDLRSDLAGLSGTARSASVYWGSIDVYNYIDVLGTDASGNIDYAHPLATIGGGQLPGNDGNWYNSSDNRRLFIDFSSTEGVAALRFSSTGVAFEFDTLALGTTLFDAGAPGAGLPSHDQSGAVPEPASWAMMLGGFGLVGGAMRRRRVNLAFA